jgi:hypothetical protein
MKARLIRILEILRQDWLLVLVALGVSILYWWNVTQRQIVTKFLPQVEVNLDTNLKPSLRLSDRQEPKPKVSVRMEGPLLYLDTMTSSSFQINADLSGISTATRTQVVLEPEDFIMRSYLVAGGVPADQFRVSHPGGISPGSILVETVWNKTVANIVPNVGGRPATGYILASTKVTPATLAVAGAQADIAQLKSISNKNQIVLRGETSMPVQYWTLSDLALGNLEVLDWDPNKPIRFEMSIEPQYMDKEFKQVQVKVLGATAETPLYDYSPKTVDVHLQGFRPSVLEVTNTSFALGIGLAGLKTGTNYLNASLLQPVNLPANVDITQVTPPTVAVRLGMNYGPPFPIIREIPRELPIAAGPSTSEGTPTVEASGIVSASGVNSATVEGASP